MMGDMDDHKKFIENRHRGLMHALNELRKKVPLEIQEAPYRLWLLDKRIFIPSRKTLLREYFWIILMVILPVISWNKFTVNLWYGIPAGICWMIYLFLAITFIMKSRFYKEAHEKYHKIFEDAYKMEDGNGKKQDKQNKSWRIWRKSKRNTKKS